MHASISLVIIAISWELTSKAPGPLPRRTVFGPEIMTAALIADAVQTGRAVSAFDVITLEYAEAIVQAAEKTSRSVILQVSRSTVCYHGGALRPLAVALRAIASAATVPVSLHLDLVDSGELIR